MNEFLSTPEGIDVDGIMAQIQERIEQKKNSGVLRQSEITDIEQMELLPLPDFLEVPNVYRQHLYPPPPEIPPYEPFPFSPDPEAGSGAKGLLKKTLKLGRRLFLPLLRFMNRPLNEENKRAAVDLANALKTDLHHARREWNELKATTLHSREYIILLHNALNNIIVEMSKLKIEGELLKTRSRVLEDRVEFLENRLRAAENRQTQRS